jgi:hypothetical protein
MTLVMEPTSKSESAPAPTAATSAGRPRCETATTAAGARNPPSAPETTSCRPTAPGLYDQRRTDSRGRDPSLGGRLAAGGGLRITPWG